MYDHTKEVIQFALCETLAFIRALHWSHQQSMWTSEDYGHRMLFDKLRWATSAEIDELAEQCVTFFGSESINQIDQCQKMNKILGWVSDENPIKQAELLEDKFLGYLLSVYEMVATAKKMTMGLDITLQNMAKTHENNLYLLRQSSKVKKASLTQATPQSRVASRYLEKQGFNKYNVPELVGQLMSVLEKNGLEDTVAELKQRGFTKIINRAWQNRER